MESRTAQSHLSPAPARGRVLTPHRYLLALCLAFSLLSAGCRSVPRDSRHSWGDWKLERHTSVAGSNGWLTLIARHWLPQGETEVGSEPGQDLVLPRDRAPGQLGTFRRSAAGVWFRPAPGIRVTSAGQPVSELEMATDAGGRTPTPIEYGTLRLFLIERGERIGVRVRDLASPARKRFRGIDYFPFQPEWQREGRFEPTPDAPPLAVPDVTGNTQRMKRPGNLHFEVGGRALRLIALEEPGEDRLFILFHDLTAGQSTYGAGRFLYVDRPGPDGRVLLDFNRAYNPPCAFTPFATCPLPPRENHLPIAIPAGEKAPDELH